MRISADPMDPGYNPEAAQFITVLLDGVRRLDVVTADTDAGMVIVYDRNEDGTPKIISDGASNLPILATKTLTGEVSLLLATAGADMLRPPRPPNFARTAYWLQACGKESGNLDHLSVQVGVHIEEMMEFVEQLALTESEDVDAAVSVLKLLATQYKRGMLKASFKNEEKALDALCDTEVTLNGVAYLAAWDKPKADELVLAANDAKLVEGKPVLLEGGKIGKPEGWQAADLSGCV